MTRKIPVLSAPAFVTLLCLCACQPEDKRTYVDCGDIRGGWVVISEITGEHDIPEILHETYEFILVSADETFNISDTRIAINDLDTPASVTFTSQKSQTFSISTTTSVQAKFYEWLTATVSSTITTSKTTQIGVSATATAPARSGIRGDYGVHAYDVTYSVRTFRARTWGAEELCWDAGTEIQTMNAPTTIEGWRLTQL